MITIDVVSDVICPWCFLGKRRLDKAVAGVEGIETEIRWRPFQLDPTVPKGGIPRRDYMRRKFGSDERIAELHVPLKRAGDTDGIAYAFDKITVTPNTLDAHRLIRWAQEAGRQDAMVERLFELYWLEGQDIGDASVLTKAAVDVGMDGPLVAQLLGTEADLDPVIDEINQAQRMGVSGVPTFIIAGRFAVSGAREPEVLRRAIYEAARQPVDS